MAIVHDYLAERGGAERVAISLSGVFSGAPIFTSLYVPDRYPELADVQVKASVLNRVPGLQERHRLTLPLLPLVFRSMKVQEDAELVVCSSSGWAHGIRTDLPKLVYCYNPARWLYQRDEYAKDRKRYWVASSALGPFLRHWDRDAANNCDRYLAISTVVAERIQRVYHRDAEVVPPPVTLDPRGPQMPLTGIEPGFFLVVGRLMGYKNVAAVVNAFDRLPDHRLVVIGEGPQSADLRSTARSNVTFVGRVAESELRWAYQNCQGLISASYEDFGLTPVEVGLFGKPSVVLRSGGFLDTTIEGVNGVFFDEPHSSSIADAVRVTASTRWNAAAIVRATDRFSEKTFADRLLSEANQMLGHATNQTATRRGRTSPPAA